MSRRGRRGSFRGSTPVQDAARLPTVQRTCPAICPAAQQAPAQVAGRVDAMRTISGGAGRGGTACRGAVRHTSLSRRSRSRLTVSEERRERGVELATLSLPSSMSVAGALRRCGEGSGGTVLSGAWRLGKCTSSKALYSSAAPKRRELCALGRSSPVRLQEGACSRWYACPRTTCRALPGGCARRRACCAPLRGRRSPCTHKMRHRRGVSICTSGKITYGAESVGPAQDVVAPASALP